MNVFFHNSCVFGGEKKICFSVIITLHDFTVDRIKKRDHIGLGTHVRLLDIINHSTTALSH